MDENRKKILEKVKLGKFSTESEIFLGNRGQSETGEKCNIASEGWIPRVWFLFGVAGAVNLRVKNECFVM